MKSVIVRYCSWIVAAALLSQDVSTSLQCGCTQGEESNSLEIICLMSFTIRLQNKGGESLYGVYLEAWIGPEINFCLQIIPEAQKAACQGRHRRDLNSSEFKWKYLLMNIALGNVSVKPFNQNVFHKMANARGVCGGFFCFWHPLDLSNLRNFDRFTRQGEGKVETGEQIAFLPWNKEEVVCGVSVLWNEMHKYENTKFQEMLKLHF